jgi:hypothetical protein
LFYCKTVCCSFQIEAGEKGQTFGANVDLLTDGEAWKKSKKPVVPGKCLVSILFLAE